MFKKQKEKFQENLHFIQMTPYILLKYSYMVTFVASGILNNNISSYMGSELPDLFQKCWVILETEENMQRGWGGTSQADLSLISI